MKRKNIITKALFLLFAVMSVAVAKAGDNKLYIEDFTIVPGQTTTIAVQLDNEDPISSLQFDVTLPDGLSIWGYTKNNDRLTRTSHTLSMNNIGGNTERFVILENAADPAKSAIKLNEGALFTINVSASSTFKSGTILIRNIDGSNNTTAQAIPVSLADQTTNVVARVADYSLNVHEGTLRKGETMEVGFLLDNIVSVNGLEAVVELPEGIELAADEDGEYFGYTDRLSDNTIIGYNPANGKIVISSLTNDYFEGNEGLLFTFKLKATADFGKDATVQVNVKDVKVSNITSTSYNLKDQEGISVTMLSSYFTYEGVAYIIDVETGKFVAAGHDWGTRGMVNEIGLDLTFAIVPDTKFVTIDSRVANNANNHFLGSNLYMDSPAANWGLLEQEFGFYITNGTQYLSIDAEDNLVLSDTPRLWIIVTPEGVKEQRLADMAEATEENPVDATWMIQGANFNRNDARNSAWQVTAEGNTNLSGGEATNTAAEAYMATFDINQTLSGLPAGTYQLQAQAAVTFHDNRAIKEYDGNGYPVVYAGDQTANFNDMVEEDRLTNMNQICNQFTAGQYEIEPIIVKVTDGTLTIGIKSERNDIWAMWDNFRLTYLGAPASDPIIEAAKTALQDAITAAKAANVEGMTAESVQALNDAIAAAEAALAAETATVESLNAAKTDVEAAVAGLVVAPLFADGKYYIYNNDVQKYLAAGSSWGTHAVVNATGLDYILTLADGKYTMDSQVSNGGNNHFLNGEWNDGGAMGWTFEAVEGKEGVYTISDGTQFLTAQENGEVLLKEDATVEAAQWTLKTVEARVAELADATAEAPVDASFLITDANFGRNDLRKSAWTTEASNLNMSGGNNTNNCAESYHSVFSLSQTLTNLPKGVYALTAQGFYRQDGQDNDNLPVFFANNEAITFPAKTGSENNMSQASESFTAGNYTIAPIYVQVAEDGQLTVGAKLEENTALWCIWDNFQLTYYGADADIEQLKNAAIIAELAALREQLAEKKDQVEVEVVKTEAENALTATADVTGTDAINAAVETLKAALDKVEASLDAKAKLANMKELVDATNVYTAEAKNEYYDQWVVKYNDGTITKAEANALQDPFIVTGWHANITVDNFLLSAWDTNPDFQDAPYYINSWSIEGESDGSNFKVPFFEYWTNDDSSLGEKTLTATMNGLEAGEYNVTAWVRVRMKNGAEAPATGVKLQANDGEAVDVCDGEAFGPMYVKEVAATGTVAEDGVLKIKFNVAADNNVSWLSFKNVKFEKHVESVHTWNFTKWSEATVANLKADAAASKVAGWSDVEKKADAEAGNDAPEATKDNCFWAVIAEGGELTANGEVIEELKGLQFGAAFAGNRSLAIAVNYPTTSLGTYAGPAYLWLGGKNFECFTIPAVKGGTTIKMGVESHKLTDARGVQLFAGETELKDAAGNAVAAPTTYTEQTWVVPEGKAFDIVVKNTNGCHIYFIDAEQDEETLTSINTVKSNINDGVIYNLNGQKVDKAQKGLFIINGKKVVIK